MEVMNDHISLPMARRRLFDRRRSEQRKTPFIDVEEQASLGG
jgi:hypothetical protein